MTVHLATPTPDQLEALVADLASWQREGLPVQLHPGDLGWRWRFGAAPLAAALRVWTVDGTTAAVGLVDDSSLVRLALAPSADHDDELAQVIVRDLEDPARGVLDADELSAEVRFGAALRSRLRARGWVDGEAWTPLVHDLRDPRAPLDPTDLRVEVVGPDHVDDRVAVQRAAFERSAFTAELWQVMAQTAAYGRARCLVGYDEGDRAVAAVTVWSAGPGRPGLLEPLGVHRDHRGEGHGRAISLAAAAALRELGASSALVATPSANVGAVATYASAGFVQRPEVTDFVRRR